jgi:N6-adenosine-specific RNA methylase IME4
MTGPYRVIYADPPWKFSAGPNKNPSRHYPTMPLKAIAALPVKEMAHPEGCRLLMWVTPPILLLPFGPREVMTAWGFRYSTIRTWAKLYPKEDGAFIYPGSISRGSGYEVSGDAEFLVIGKRGRPQRIQGAKPRGLFYGRRREHSRKPDFIRDEICALFEGPRIELFARSRHPGFDAWGDEVDKFQVAA